MNSEQLIQFKKVAELEHMTKAADELFMTQANLSRSIASIERELGAPLFDRVGRNIKLNDAGRAFYNRCLRIISDYSDARAEVRLISEKSNYQVAFGTNVAAYTPELLSLALSKTSGMRIKQISGPRKSLVSMLKNRRIDLVLTAPPLRQIEIESTTIFNEQPVVIYPDGHWLAQRNTISIEELADEAFVGVPEGYGARDCMNRHFAKFDVSPNYAIETSETVSIARFVKKGFGIAIVPKSVVLSNAIPQNNMIELEEDLPCPVALSWRKGYALNENERLIVDAALTYFNESAAPLLHSTTRLLGPGELG